MDSLPCTVLCRGKVETIEIAPDEHYDLVQNELISHENLLRLKFLGLALFKIWAWAPLQLAYRGYDVCTGGFYYRGYDNALHAHRVAKSLRGQAMSLSHITSYVLLELIKDVGRIVLFPLYLAALALTAVVGLFLPETGRRLFNRIEQIFFVQAVNPYAPASTFELIGNLTAPCMMSKEFRKEMHLYRHMAANNLYHPNTNLSLINRLEHLMKKAALYFTIEELAHIREGQAKLIKPHITKERREAKCLATNKPVYFDADEYADPSQIPGQIKKLNDQRQKLLDTIAALEMAISEWSSSTSDTYKQSLWLAGADLNDEVPPLVPATSVVAQQPPRHPPATSATPLPPPPIHPRTPMPIIPPGTDPNRLPRATRPAPPPPAPGVTTGLSAFTANELAHLRRL